MRFDYLRDAPPDGIESLRAFYSAREWRGTLALAVVVLTIALGAWVFERCKLLEWRRELAGVQARFDHNRRELAAMQGELRYFRVLAAFDGDLRGIRLSGALTAKKVAILANQLPPRVWLTSIISVDDGYDVSGHALGLAAIGDTLSVYAGAQSSHLIGLREPAQGGTRIVDFQVHVGAP